MLQFCYKQSSTSFSPSNIIKLKNGKIFELIRPQNQRRVFSADFLHLFAEDIFDFDEIANLLRESYYLYKNKYMNGQFLQYFLVH